ncbi:DinB family protein [bacterium]|nr:DinB family protein [bacterium]
MKSQLAEAWRMSQETNMFLLQNIAEEYLNDRYSARTRTVAAQFAHMHNVRLRWLGHAAPDLLDEVPPFPKGAQPPKVELRAALEASEEIMTKFLERCEASGQVPKWDGSPATFLGYMIAHEAHHRGLIMVALRASGHKLPQEVVYGQWQWGKKRNLRGSKQTSRR